MVWMACTVGAVMAQPDRSEVRQGNRDFYKGKFTNAVSEYSQALERDSTSIAARYNLSNTQYKQELYESAEEGLKAKMDAILEQSQRADAFHNLGNMQLLQKKYAESIESYKDALRLRPNDRETKSNLAYAQKMLQNQDEEGDGDQDQDNQDQDNQDQNQNQDQNKDQNQNQDQKEQEAPPKITPQDARQMLEAMQQKERETLEKVEKEKDKAAVLVRPSKNW